jgi:hypothetical protein
VARRTPTGVEVSDYDAGSGRWATFEETHVHLARGGCDTERFSLQGGKASLIQGLKIDPGGRFGDIVALLDAVWVSEPANDDLAAARMLVQDASGMESVASGQGLPGTALPVQPDHAGRPHGSPRAFWDKHALSSASVAPSRLVDEAGEPRAGLVTAPIPAPIPLASRGRWELWEVRLATRLGGGLLAVYDVANDRTRWVLGTELDAGTPIAGGGSHFELLVFDGDLLVVRTHDGGDQALWAIDLARGLTRAVAPGQPETFRHAAGDPN